MALPIYATTGQRIWYYTFRVICGLIFFYLIAPIFVILPLSFSSGEYFTYGANMFGFNADGDFSMATLKEAYGLKHYHDALTNEWMGPLKNSFIIAIPATILSVSLGTLAAIGLSQSHVPFKRPIMAILISPMIVPLVVSGYGMALFYAPLANFFTDTVGLDKTFVRFAKVIFAHAVLGIPFVIITVTATLVSFDDSLTKASANMGAGPLRTFFKVQMPLILPGMIAGGLFAFITSFDEVVVIIFLGSAEVQSLPWQMFTGLREQISLTILAVATMLVTFSIILLISLELLRRRSERLRGITES